MKDGTDTIKKDSHARSVALADLCSKGFEHCFDIRPSNIRLHRISKDGLNSLIMLAHSAHSTIL